MDNSPKITGDIDADAAKLLRLQDEWSTLRDDYAKVTLFTAQILRPHLGNAEDDFKEFEREFLKYYSR